MRPPRQMSEGMLKTSDGKKLHLRVTEPRAPCVGSLLVVHGWGEHLGSYDELAEDMSKRGFQVWRFDLRGHGRSGGLRGHTPSFQRLVEDFSEVQARVHAESPRPNRLFVLGHSMGGLLVLRALQTGAVRPQGACVSAPWLKTVMPVAAWKRRLARVMNLIVPFVPVWTPIDPAMLTSDLERIRAREDDRLVHSWITPRLAQEVSRVQETVLKEPTVRGVPLLVLIPQDDPVVDPETTTHFVKRLSESEVTVVVIKGARHEPLNEVDRRDRFDEVGAFFLRLSAGDPRAQ